MRKFYIALGFLVLMVPKVEAQSVPYTKNSADWYPFVEALNRGDKQVLNFGCGSLAEVMNKNFSEMHLNDCRDIGKHASTLKQIDCSTDSLKAAKLIVAKIVDDKVTNLVDTVSLMGEKCRRDTVTGRVEFVENGALVLGEVQEAPVPAPRKTMPTKAVAVGKGSPKVLVPPVNTIHVYHRDTLHTTDTLRLIQRVEVLVPQESKPCWRFALTKCTFWTGVGAVVAGVGTTAAICHNPPNKVYTVCGGTPDTTNIYNENKNHVAVASRTGTGGRSIKFRASVPTSVIFKLLRRK
jgi:hypothetical protein